VNDAAPQKAGTEPSGSEVSARPRILPTSTALRTGQTARAAACADHAGPPGAASGARRPPSFPRQLSGLCRRYVRATDLTRLPPAFVSVGAIGGFRDEDVDYAVRLNQAGVPCELHVYPGVPHGYQMAQATTVVRRAAGHIEDWLSAQLAADGAK
jgi:acetyl esterase/lipase